VTPRAPACEHSAAARATLGMPKRRVLRTKRDLVEVDGQRGVHGQRLAKGLHIEHDLAGAQGAGRRNGSAAGMAQRGLEGLRGWRPGHWAQTAQQGGQAAHPHAQRHCRLEPAIMRARPARLRPHRAPALAKPPSGTKPQRVSGREGPQGEGLLRQVGQEAHVAQQQQFERAQRGLWPVMWPRPLASTFDVFRRSVEQSADVGRRRASKRISNSFEEQPESKASPLGMTCPPAHSAPICRVRTSPVAAISDATKRCKRQQHRAQAGRWAASALRPPRPRARGGGEGLQDASWISLQS